MEIRDAQLLDHLWMVAEGPTDLAALHRADPRLVDEVVRFLATPRACQVVEDVEAGVLALWRDVLWGRPGRDADVEACAEFFSRLGFLHKYKVYGVKVALPFGYSLFDLADGQGFSFQIHETPKLEGFHVLAPKQHALLYVAGLDEWEGGDREWAMRRCGVPGRHPAHWGKVRGALEPREGDVTSVSRTHTVHTVLGCVLEEYASCSVDSVVRLYDQNTRSEPPLPRAHTPAARLLGRGSTGLPVRRLTRSSEGWAIGESDPGCVIDTDNVVGRRYVLGGGATLDVPAGAWITSVVVVKGRVHASVARLRLDREPGEVVVVPPGVEATVTATEQTTVAVHRVPTEMAAYHWDR
jgi:hypothetical protein